MAFNVKDPQFGAVGNGQVDDTVAIQKAVDMAKNTATSGGGAYRPTIYFPAGYYYITSPIDITGTNGLWLVGDGGKWLGSCMFGNTSGVIFDFSGSNLSGCENFYFLSTAPSGSTRSTIGVLFALSSSGGLNCGIRNCSFNMEDFPTSNGGFGSVGILNVRAEEFYVHECFVRANTPIIMSNAVALGATGTNFTVSSSYKTLTAGIGSMGVTSIIGTSLQSYEKRQPALVLNGTNSLNFQGYIGRGSANTGSNETAILCSQYTINLRIHATIESFSRMVKVVNTSFENIELNLVIANSTAPTTDLVDLTGCFVKGLKLNVLIPNVSERNNRYIVYYAPDSGGYQQAGGYIKNSEINCYDIPDNQYIISANLLKKAVNVLFQTDRPFEKRSGRIRQLTNNIVSAGTVGSVTAAIVLQFRQSNQLPFNNTNGGYYRIWLDGVVRSGNQNSGFSCTLCFQAQIVVNQIYNGTFDMPSITVITLDKSASNPSYLDIAGVIVDISFANGLGSVTVLPRVMGSGTAEPVSYEGFAEIQSSFLVNDPIPVG